MASSHICGESDRMVDSLSGVTTTPVIDVARSRRWCNRRWVGAGGRLTRINCHRYKLAGRRACAPCERPARWPADLYLQLGNSPVAMNDDSRDNRPLQVAPGLEETTVRRIIGILVGLAGLLLVLGLVAVLPAVDRLLSALAVPLTALLVGVATLLVVGALVLLAPTVRMAVKQVIDGPDEVVEHAAASAMYLVGFGAVVIAYRGLAGALTPLFEAFDIEGFYHLAFLAAGLLVLAALTRRLYRCWGPVTDLLTSYVTDALGGTRPSVSTKE